mgnify:CR=1 FL=1
MSKSKPSDKNRFKLAPGATLSAPEAKQKIIDLINEGFTVEDSCRATGKSIKSYEYYRASDPEFKKSIDLSREVRNRRGVIAPDDKNVSFEKFRQAYLNSQTFAHQKNVISLLEEGKPAWLHDSMIYEPGFPNYVLVNMPPEHAKSMTVSIDYVTYRIAIDPNVRIKLVSKTQAMAKEFLYAVKQRLTHPNYAELQRRYAPVEGYKATSEKWTQDAIYLERDSGEKDPTLQALGIGGQIYGARADLIILDDCVTLANANEFEKQIRWIQQEVLTRVGPTGKILVVGTRVDPMDLYREMRNPERYPDNKSPWTYLAMPAVLEFKDDANDWITLWPKSDRPWAADNAQADADGLYPRWDGANLKKRRGVLDPKTWAMVYQQQDVESTAVFSADCVRGSVSGMRAAGALIPGAPGHPDSLPQGIYTICSMDPAMSGDTFSVAYSGDRVSGKRYVLDASRMPSPTPAAIRELIFSWTEKYQPKVWVIEKNAFQLFLTQDEEINKFLASRGIRLVHHYTGSNKMDAEFGVASMAPLFGSVDSQGKHMKNNLIDLPRSDNESIKALIEQLITWSAGTKNKQDGPMALWFAETQMRDYINQSGVYGGSWVKNPFLTPNDLRKRRVVNLEEYAKLQEKIAANGGYGTWL